jgi:hypothetical protein
MHRDAHFLARLLLHDRNRTGRYIRPHHRQTIGLPLAGIKRERRGMP